MWRMWMVSMQDDWVVRLSMNLGPPPLEELDFDGSGGDLEIIIMDYMFFL